MLLPVMLCEYLPVCCEHVTGVETICLCAASMMLTLCHSASSPIRHSGTVCEPSPARSNLSSHAARDGTARSETPAPSLAGGTDPGKQSRSLINSVSNKVPLGNRPRYDMTDFLVKLLAYSA